MRAIPKINRILYATDLSESSNHAYQYAVALANLSDAEITVLHVLSDLPPTVMAISVGRTARAFIMPT